MYCPPLVHNMPPLQQHTLHQQSHRQFFSYSHRVRSNCLLILHQYPSRLRTHRRTCNLLEYEFDHFRGLHFSYIHQDGDNGIPIRYRFDGKLFSLRRLQAKTKVQTEMLDEFLFPDGMAKDAPTEEKMQNGVDQVSDSYDNYDLTISIKKTGVVFQPAPGKSYKEPTITVKGQRLKVVDKFTYLGSTLSRVVQIDDEVNARISKASAAFGRLRGSIWDWSGIRLDTKLNVYRSVVLPTLLYACETWTVYQRHAKRLNHFHTSCLRKNQRSSGKTGFQTKKFWKGQGCRVYILFWNWHS